MSNRFCAQAKDHKAKIQKTPMSLSQVQIRVCSPDVDDGIGDSGFSSALILRLRSAQCGKRIAESAITPSHAMDGLI